MQPPARGDGTNTPSASAVSAPTSSQSAGAGGGKKVKGRSGPKSKFSPFIGVSQYKRTGRWEAHIWDSNSSTKGTPVSGSSKNGKGKQLHLGSFPSAVHAARAYDRAAILLRGTGAALNYPLEDYEDDPMLEELGKMTRPQMILALRKSADVEAEAAALEAFSARVPHLLQSMVSSGHDTPSTAGAAGAGSSDGGFHTSASLTNTLPPTPAVPVDGYAEGAGHSSDMDWVQMYGQQMFMQQQQLQLQLLQQGDMQQVWQTDLAMEPSQQVAAGLGGSSHGQQPAAAAASLGDTRHLHLQGNDGNVAHLASEAAAAAAARGAAGASRPPPASSSGFTPVSAGSFDVYQAARAQQQQQQQHASWPSQAYSLAGGPEAQAWDALQQQQQQPGQPLQSHLHLSYSYGSAVEASPHTQYHLVASSYSYPMLQAGGDLSQPETQRWLASQAAAAGTAAAADNDTSLIPWFNDITAADAAAEHTAAAQRQPHVQPQQQQQQQQLRNESGPTSARGGLGRLSSPSSSRTQHLYHHDDAFDPAGAPLAAAAGAAAAAAAPTQAAGLATQQVAAAAPPPLPRVTRGQVSATGTMQQQQHKDCLRQYSMQQADYHHQAPDPSWEEYQLWRQQQRLHLSQALGGASQAAAPWDNNTNIAGQQQQQFMSTNLKVQHPSTTSMALQQHTATGSGKSMRASDARQSAAAARASGLPLTLHPGQQEHGGAPDHAMSSSAWLSDGGAAAAAAMLVTAAALQAGRGKLAASGQALQHPRVTVSSGWLQATTHHVPSKSSSNLWLQQQDAQLQQQQQQQQPSEQQQQTLQAVLDAGGQSAYQWPLAAGSSPWPGQAQDPGGKQPSHGPAQYRGADEAAGMQQVPATAPAAAVEASAQALAADPTSQQQQMPSWPAGAGQDASTAVSTTHRAAAAGGSAALRAAAASPPAQGNTAAGVVTLPGVAGQAANTQAGQLPSSMHPAWAAHSFAGQHGVQHSMQEYNQAMPQAITRQHTPNQAAVLSAAAAAGAAAAGGGDHRPAGFITQQPWLQQLSYGAGSSLQPPAAAAAGGINPAAVTPAAHTITVPPPLRQLSLGAQATLLAAWRAGQPSQEYVTRSTLPSQAAAPPPPPPPTAATAWTSSVPTEQQQQHQLQLPRAAAAAAAAAGAHHGPAAARAQPVVRRNSSSLSAELARAMSGMRGGAGVGGGVSLGGGPLPGLQRHGSSLSAEFASELLLEHMLCTQHSLPGLDQLDALLGDNAYNISPTLSGIALSSGAAQLPLEGSAGGAAAAGRTTEPALQPGATAAAGAAAAAGGADGNGDAATLPGASVEAEGLPAAAASASVTAAVVAERVRASGTAAKRNAAADGGQERQKRMKAADTATDTAVQKGAGPSSQATAAAAAAAAAAGASEVVPGGMLTPEAMSWLQLMRD